MKLKPCKWCGGEVYCKFLNGEYRLVCEDCGSVQSECRVGEGEKE